MLAALTALVLCQEGNDGGLDWKFLEPDPSPWARPKGAFDITYKRGSITADGFFPVFKVDNYPEEIPITGFDNGTVERHGVKMVISLELHGKQNFVYIRFTAISTDGDYHNISVSCYADIKIGLSTYTKITEYKEFIGLQMEESFTITGKPIKLGISMGKSWGLYDVDDFWVGNSTEGNRHYWENSKSKLEPGRYDAAISFSFRNRKFLRPEWPIDFGVLVGVSEDLLVPPRVQIQDEISENYLPNSEINLKFFLSWYYMDNVTVYYNITNSKGTKYHIYGEIPSRLGGFDLYRPLKFKLGSEVDNYKLTIWAVSATNLVSNLEVRNFRVNQAPQLEIKGEIKDKYYTSGIIEVQGVVWDESNVTIAYQFDDLFIFGSNETYVCNGEYTSFRTVLPIFNRHLPYGTHVLKIWAIDIYNSTSKVYTRTFNYVEGKIPEINITQGDEIKTFKYHEPIVVKGYVRDANYNSPLKIYYLLPDAKPYDSFSFFKDVDTQFNWEEFEFINLPQNFKKGENKITFKAVDRNDAVSYYAYYFFNYDPIDDPIIVVPDIKKEPVNESDAQNKISIDTKNTYAQEKERQTKMVIIIVAAAACAVVAMGAIIAAIIIVHEHKKYKEAKKRKFVFNPETAKTISIADEYDNPLYGEKDEDPFVDDFEEPQEIHMFH